jgi:amidase
LLLKPPTLTEFSKVSDELGFKLGEKDLTGFLRYLEKYVVPAFSELEAMEEPKLLSDNAVRDPGHFPAPEENKFGAWAWMCSVKGKNEGILSGKRIALKDNISLAGVPMTNGTGSMRDFVPQIDAEVVRRVIAAGGEIVGKATCENLCWTGGSNTSFPQSVLNPNNPRFMAGGSSSGSGALVAAGEVDMAIGCDQGGSIRIPSSWCGIFGLKPTYGLVPYTGIVTGEMSFDHAGPMASTVQDLALLLEVLAGRDGFDPRQAMAGTPPDTPKYSQNLGAEIDGLKIGLVSEGFGWDESEPDVEQTVRKSATTLEELGAKVSEVSIPIHRKASAIMTGIDLEGSWRTLQNGGVNFGTLGYYDSELARFIGCNVKAGDGDFSSYAKLAIIYGQYLLEKYHSVYYAKAQNLRPSVREKYDEALRFHDVLVMPTTPQKAQPFPDREPDLVNYINSGLNMISNTAPFDYTGHPALNVPCGKSDGLPIGMMIVGRHFDEQTILNTAFAFERLSANLGRT